ncbi:hypothetical protein [Nocardioides alcanivorans]|uniref:hypothetical protein n=1 Tax=Nocardioides alcanivorans TaxID=2897352 RepID=UPI001F1A9C76|nr:hypothetical protein [Nocardioides alcanivorans]
MGKKKDKAKLKAKAKDKKALKKKMPKSKCCVSKDRCKRCPIRMLKEGTLPAGYTVKKRKLVKIEKLTKKKLAKAA